MAKRVRWWGMIPGKNHSADALFASASVVAIDYLGGKEEGDLSDLVGGSKEQVLERFEQSLLRHPEPHIRDTGYHAGNIYRFLTELAVGDIVVFRTLLPEETRGTVHVVRIVGDYTYRPKAVEGFVHQRRRKPITTFAGNELPDQAFGEIMARHTIWELGEEARSVISRFIAESK